MSSSVNDIKDEDQVDIDYSPQDEVPEQEETKYTYPSRSQDQGDDAHENPEFTDSPEKTEKPTLKTAPQNEKDTAKTLTAKPTSSPNISLSQEELSEMKNTNPLAYLKLMMST